MCDGVTGCATGCVCRLSVTMCVCRAVCVPECYENSLTLWPTMCAIICYVCVHMCVCLCVWVCMRRWHWLWQGQPTAPGQAQPGQAQLSSTQGRAGQGRRNGHIRRVVAIVLGTLATFTRRSNFKQQTTSFPLISATLLPSALLSSHCCRHP